MRRQPLYGGDAPAEFGHGLGLHRDVYIEPINEHDAFFNEHHHDPYKEHMPEGPTEVPYLIDHTGHVEVIGADHHLDHHLEHQLDHQLDHHVDEHIAHHDLMDTTLAGIEEMPRYFLQ